MAKQPFHRSTQEWEYYVFDGMPDALRWVARQIENGRMDALSWHDVNFIDYTEDDNIDGDHGIAVLRSYINH